MPVEYVEIGIDCFVANPFAPIIIVSYQSLNHLCSGYGVIK